MQLKPTNPISRLFSIFSTLLLFLHSLIVLLLHIFIKHIFNLLNNLTQFPKRQPSNCNNFKKWLYSPKQLQSIRPDHKSLQLTKANAFKLGPKTILLATFVDHIITLILILIMSLNDNNFLTKPRLVIIINDLIFFIFLNWF